MNLGSWNLPRPHFEYVLIPSLIATFSTKGCYSSSGNQTPLILFDLLKLKAIAFAKSFWSNLILGMGPTDLSILSQIALASKIPTFLIVPRPVWRSPRRLRSIIASMDHPRALSAFIWSVSGASPLVSLNNDGRTSLGKNEILVFRFIAE